jgi:hypothetical protein
MPFHPPSITAEESVDEIREAAGPEAPLGGGQIKGTPSAALNQDRAKDSKPRTKRFWLTALLGLVVIAAAVAAVLMTLSTQSPPDVVPYPTVTGVLGEHLEELQKSVEP